MSCREFAAAEEGGGLNEVMAEVIFLTRVSCE